MDRLAALPSAGPVAQLHRNGSADEESLNRFLDRAEELLHHDPRSATELAELVQAAADDWPAVRGRARYQLARLSAEAGDLPTALRLIAEARGLWLEAGDQLAALRTDLGRMQVLDDLGQHAEAARVGEVLIVAINTTPALAEDPRAQLIRTYATDNVGAAYGFTGQHARALAAYEESERSYRALGMDDDAARPLANRAVELLALGRPREALEALRTAIAGFRSSGDRLFAAQCLGDMALAHQQLGELMESLTLLETARQTLAELGAHAEAERLQLALIETYLAVGMLDEARAQAQATQERTAQAGMVHDHARATYNLALSYLAVGNAPAAEDELMVAAQRFREVDDRQYLARTHLAQAEAAALRQDTGEATTLAEQAVDALAAGGWRLPLAWARLLLSDWADTSTLAQEHCDAAQVLVEDLRLPELTHQWGLRAARLHRRNGRTGAALAALRSAVSDLDRAGAALPDHALRTSFRRDRFAAHDELADLLLELGDISGAAAVADEAKARTLRDLISESADSGPDLAGGVGALAVAYADLNATYVAMHQTTDGGSLSELRAQAVCLERRVSELRLRGSVSRSGAIGLAGSSEDMVGAATDPDALAYHVLGNDVVIFLRRAGQVSACRLTGVVNRVAEHLDELGAQWSRFSLGRAFTPRQEALMLASTRESLSQLYDLLLRPVEGFVGEHDTEHGGTTLRIVPHRLLGSVPFHTLFDGRRYLLERMSVAVVPTLAIAPTATGAGAGTSEPWKGGPALVVAAPDEVAPEVAVEGELVAARLREGGHVGAVRLLSGADATVDAMIEALPDARLIHLACHGVYRADNPLFSRLRLSDRWLTSAEIVQLKMPGALVALSACESGRHGHSAEPVGLGWAFLAAGATGVVVSQWMVHDDAAGDLMADYYDRLNAGDPPAEALRQAQLQAAVLRPHPYYWAPFTYLHSPTHSQPPRSNS